MEEHHWEACCSTFVTDNFLKEMYVFLFYNTRLKYTYTKCY